MANMTFKANLLPNIDLGYNLGSSDLRWNIYGNLTGNASTADKWKTARTLTIGATEKSVDGSANISWSKTEIIGSGNTGQFLRGDHTWTNELVSTSTTDAGGNILKLRTTATIASGYQYGVNHLVPNLTGSSNSNTVMLTGVANSAGNQGYIGFHYVGAANNGNWVSLGIYGKDHLIKAFYTGYVATSGTTQFSNTTSWNSGTAIVGADGKDKAIVGYENGSVNEVVFGAHTTECTAWAPVNLSGTQINFRSSDTLIFAMNSSRLLNNYIATTLGTAPSSNMYLGGLHFIDTAGNDVGYYRCFHWTNQVIGLQIETKRSINGTMKFNTLNLGIDTSGNATVGISGTNAAASWRAALGLGSNATSSTAYLPLAGGAMTGAIQYNGKGNNSIYNGPNDQAATYNGTLNNFVISSWYGVSFTTSCTGQTCTGKSAVSINCRNGYVYTGRTYGAVWNDYAEYRKDNPIEKEQQESGRCVREIGDGSLELTTKRLERGCEIISDTFGFAIGQDEENGYDTPIASSGRVLAYPYESIEEFKKHIGYCVCSGPNGTVSIMTDEEEEKYPGRIIGTISEIPTYEEWGTGKVKVNGRVWIRIR